MSSRTTNFSLSLLGQFDHLSDDGYKFTSQDPQTVDTLLEAALTRRPGASAYSTTTPSSAPTLTLYNTGGLIPASTRVYYKYTLVSLAGVESLPSPESFIDTPAAIGSPGAAALAILTGGTLPGGSYNYTLSAYKGSNTAESLAGTYSTIIAPNSPTNKIRLILPSLPSGATGFNVYRRSPGQSKFFYLTSINMQVATPPSVFDDDGTVLDNCDRTLPITNTTNSTNSIKITYPGATPTIPVGYTWKIYRTYTPGNYSNSLLHWVVENTFEGSGIIIPYYTDVGIGTSAGTPPSAILNIPGYGKILLTNGAEVTGELPVGLLSGHLDVLRFEMPGALAVVNGDTQWACPYGRAKIVGVKANVGVSGAPSSAITVDVNLNGTTIWTNPANRATVPSGQTVGSLVTNMDVTSLVAGDKITVDVDTVGTGATPVAGSNLLVQILILAEYGSTTVSEVY